MNALREALEAARDHIKLNHKATAWHNDPAAWEIITKVIEPALKGCFARWINCPRCNLWRPPDEEISRCACGYSCAVVSDMTDNRKGEKCLRF